MTRTRMLKRSNLMAVRNLAKVLVPVKALTMADYRRLGQALAGRTE